jgi:hypothetical protein
MNYNSFIPRKFKTDISIDAALVTNINLQIILNLQDYHSEAFETIEANPILSEFYDTNKRVCETIREICLMSFNKKWLLIQFPAFKKPQQKLLLIKIQVSSVPYFSFKHLWKKSD